MRCSRRLLDPIYVSTAGHYVSGGRPAKRKAAIMSSEDRMATYIPALRSLMGDLEYYVSTVTFGEAARMVEYVENVDSWTSETPPELKLQRRLNQQRVERELVPYLTSNPDHFYSALTVEVRPAPYAGGEGTVAFEAKDSFP